MPPKKRIHADPDDALLRISRHIASERAGYEREIKRSDNPGHRDRLRQAIRDARIVDYDLAIFSGKRQLTPSEKQAWRKAILELESQRVIKVYGQRATAVELTTKGRKRIRELNATKTAKKKAKRAR